MGARQGFSARTSPAFAIGGTTYEPNPRDPANGYNYVPACGWRCYQCGEHFHRAVDADEHFGRRPMDPPICLGFALRVREWLEARDGGDWEEAAEQEAELRGYLDLPAGLPALQAAVERASEKGLAEIGRRLVELARRHPESAAILGVIRHQWGSEELEHLLRGDAKARAERPGFAELVYLAGDAPFVAMDLPAGHPASRPSDELPLDGQ